MGDTDIPVAATNDSIMASSQEVQAINDWVRVAFAGEKGKPTHGLLTGESFPFSFLYDGRPSSELLPTWKRTSNTKELEDGLELQVQWVDPSTSLLVSAVIRTYKRYPAADWVLYFENQGTQDTPVIEEIQALDLRFRSEDPKQPVVLHRIEGDTCSERSFMPFDTKLDPGQSIRFGPTGGRPSQAAFPFFNLQYVDQGLITAIGWSGQWAASLERESSGPAHLQAGMEQTHLRLRPGERIRSPRILVMAWQGDRQTAHNRFRRLMLFHYLPQHSGRPVRMPVVSQCFDRYWQTRPEWATEAGQLAGVRFAHEVGCDAHWFDAAWFEGGFPNGVGNWSPKPKEFPEGLKPIGDACHQAGMRFVVWFEPERVAAGSQIAREHSDFVFGGEQGGLFKLNEPIARGWLTDLLSRRIAEFGVDVYRNDFNIDPLSFWRQNDGPDRQGMTEIRYVEGLYAMWDELRAKHPGLLIDNCASGGRRIDLETCMRSVPLWRSDTSCSPGHADWNQAQSCGLSLYLPLHSACGWTPEPYDFRSSATAGAISQWDFLSDAFPVEQAKLALEEAKGNQRYWYGDFYPVTGCTTAADQWMVYQFHRPDLDAGVLLAFRHAESSYTALAVSLRGVYPQHTYRVEAIDDAHKTIAKTMTGNDLMSAMELRLAKPGSSLVIRYAPDVSGRRR